LKKNALNDDADDDDDDDDDADNDGDDDDDAVMTADMDTKYALFPNFRPNPSTVVVSLCTIL